MQPGDRLAVVGGGYVGLEAAASARALGSHAMVIERESRVLARVACETLVTTNRVVLAGEVRAGKPDGDKKANKQLTKDILGSLEPKVRAAIKDIGYEQEGFHWETCDVDVHLHAQSPHIAQGVDASDNKDEGAGEAVGKVAALLETELDQQLPSDERVQIAHASTPSACS